MPSPHNAAVILAIAMTVLPALGAANPAAKPTAPAVPEPASPYERLVQAYLAGRWADVADARKALAPLAPSLTPQQRADVEYVGLAVADHRPPWWDRCKAGTKGVFRVSYWGEEFRAMFEADEKITWNLMPLPTGTVVRVTWDPKAMDSNDPVGGSLGRRGFSKGVVLEYNVRYAMVAAHVLTRLLPGELAGALDTKYPDGRIEKADPEKKLRLQQYRSFAAELTALYYVSPRARQASLAWCLAAYKIANTPANRPRRAISAMIVQTLLEDISKWPSLKLPDDLSEDAEQAAAKFYHFRAPMTWTLAEDRALREAAWTFHHANPMSRVLAEGKIVLPSGMTFLFDIEEDKPLQAERSAWVEAHIKKARAARGTAK